MLPSQPLIPLLCLLSPHSTLAGGDSNLEDQRINWLITAQITYINKQMGYELIRAKRHLDIREVLFNLCKLGGSTAPPPGAEAWRTVWGGRCVSQSTASLYSHHLCQPKWWQANRKHKGCVNEHITMDCKHKIKVIILQITNAKEVQNRIKWIHNKLYVYNTKKIQGPLVFILHHLQYLWWQHAKLNVWQRVIKLSTHH